MSLRDPLTGLPTLELLQDRLEYTMAQHSRSGKKAVLLLLESRTSIDGSLRQVIGQRLLAAVRNTDTVAMLNEDTFAVLLTDLHDSDNAVRVADTLIHRCQAPYFHDGQSLRYRPSIGLAVFPDDAKTVPEWFHKASSALAVAKDESNGVYTFYTEDMNVRAHRRRTLALSLQKAWTRDELKIYGQPVFDRRTNTCVSVELLLRWEHPDQGIIAADQFADIAQETGIWISACERLMSAAMDGVRRKPHLRWTWNAPSTIDAQAQDDILPMDTFLNFEGSHQSIGLEVAEELLSHRPAVAHAWMKRWKDAGGFVVVDNFGQNPIAPSSWTNESIDEIKTRLGEEHVFARSMSVNYGWRCVQKNIETSVQWELLALDMLGQGNALHEAVTLETLLLDPITMKRFNR
jgi:predicted signal transduction protein with EAL and GGDEF domain